MVIIIGTDSGMMIWRKVRKVSEPSMYALSSSSSGTPRKNCRIIKMYRPFLNASPVIESSTIGQKVCVSWIELTTLVYGTPVKSEPIHLPISTMPSYSPVKPMPLKIPNRSKISK